MSFTTRRGRPPKPRETEDHGTPETRAKHSAGLLHEPLDLCLERGIITREQHWCGLHLRWLYTLRYGAPSITSHWWRILETQHGPRVREVAWQEEREREYAEARAALVRENCYSDLMQLCIYNEMPLFLKPEIQREAIGKPQLIWQLEQRQAQLIHGFEVLNHLWRSTQRQVNET
jgi:hypothetical protein